jgi:hypothetical protein
LELEEGSGPGLILSLEEMRIAAGDGYRLGDHIWPPFMGHV